MKILTYFSLILLTVSPAFANQQPLKNGAKKQALLYESINPSGNLFRDNPKTKSTCSTGTRFICQNNIGTAGLIITEPGEYCLIEDIDFEPTNDTAPAITVAASNVTIDLNGRRLMQTNAGKNNIGIFIAPGIQAVQIINGNIQGFGALGIWISKGVLGLIVESINTVACGNRGHAPYATADNFQEGGFGLFAGGLGLGGGSNPGEGITQVIIRKSNFLGTQNTETTAIDPVSGKSFGVIAVGIGASFTSSIAIEDSATAQIASVRNTARGVTVTGGSVVLVKNHRAVSLAHFNGGTGILLSNVTSGSVTDAVVDRVQDLGGVSLIQRGSIGIGVIDCKDISIEAPMVTRINNTNSAKGIAHGIDLRSTPNAIVTNAKVFDAAGNAAAVSVAGIAYAPVSVSGADRGASFINCESDGNKSIQGKAHGFLIAPLQSQTAPLAPVITAGTPQDVIVDHCNASNNTDSGFRIIGATSCVITRSIAEGNGNAGFWFTNASSCSLLHSITKNNKHFGILFDQSPGASLVPCSIESNVIENNGSGDIVNDAGVKDEYTVKNMYISNKAFNNNPQNYTGIVPTTPLIIWTVQSGAPTGAVDQKIANLDAQSH
ncbi:right-handed parallel beta-helix repeat-containing protein [Candidatus Dependentiae bacterium]|nr:right-handed parallel beta-helix repeat-containing protein [Candidatus Dependentiae bacterium]